MSLTAEFLGLLNTNGSDAIYHRDDSTAPCPCRTPEGYRDPIWHAQHPASPVCNDAGFLPGAGTVHALVKAFCQPIQSTRATRLSSEQVTVMFGEVQKDDHLGIFPCVWAGVTLNFDDWSTSGEDWVGYRGKQFIVVNSNLLPDPSDGNPFHHWELGLRLMDV